MISRNKQFFTRNNEILEASFTRNGIPLETLLGNRDLNVEKDPLYGCFASFVQLKITRNYVTFRFVYETDYYA